MYLPQPDRLLIHHVTDRLRKVRSVSLSSDGWRDRSRRNWIELGVTWMATADDESAWTIEVVDIDIIHLPGDIFGNVLAAAVKESVECFVPAECLIATSTNDGAADEQRAASQLCKLATMFGALHI